MGGIKNAIGNGDGSELQDVLDTMYDIVRSNLKGGYIEPLKNFLKEQKD